MEFFILVTIIIVLFLPIFYRLNKEVRVLEKRISDLEYELKTRNVTRLKRPGK